MSRNKISKEQIIKAAADVFSKKGLENATVSDIAKTAGIAKGSIYSYFDSRDDILLEAVRYIAQKRINLLKKLLVSFPNAKQKLKVLLKANEEMADTSPELFLMSYSLLLSTHSNIKKKATSEFFKSYLDLVQEIIEEGIENNEFKKCDSRILALSIILTQDLGDIFDRIDNGIIKRKKVRREILKLIEKN